MNGAARNDSGLCRVAFTLIELLVTMAIISILATFLLTALSRAKDSGRQISCVSNLRQLEMACQMYAADNGGKLVPNNLNPDPGQGAYANPLYWVAGTMMEVQESTNVNYIKAGMLFPYASQIAIYRCPADPTSVRGVPRVRSYSMNSWVGSRAMQTEQTTFRTFITEAELSAAPISRIFTILDELPRTLGDASFEVTMNDSAPFLEFPAIRHGTGYALNFADGHCEVYQMRDPRTFTAIYGQGDVTADNLDWINLKQVTTSH